MTRTVFSSVPTRLAAAPFVRILSAVVPVFAIGFTAASFLLPAPTAGAAEKTRSAFDYADIFTVPFPPPEEDQLLSEESQEKADALAWFIAGQILEQQAELDAALATYRKSLDLDPANYTLAERIAFEYVRREEFNEALAILKACATAAPEDARPRVTLAYLHSRFLDQPEVGKQYADQALAIDPEKLDVHRKLYEIYEAQNDQEASERVIEKALSAKSKNAEYWLHLGVWLSDLYLPVETRDPEKELVDKLAATFEKARKYADKKADLYPDILTATGDFYARADDLEKSVDYFSEALEINANLLPAREKLAQTYLHLERNEEAIEQLNEIIRLDPLRQGVYGLLAQLYEESGDIRKAAAAYEQSLLLNPNQEDGYERLAELYLAPPSADSQEPLDNEKAIEILQQGAERFSGSIRLHIMLGIANLMAQKWDPAFEAFTSADALFDREPSATQTPQFYFRYGIAAERSKRFDKAAELFQAAIELDPSAHDALNYLGYMWIDRNENLEEAADLVRRALAIEPENPAYLDSLGWYYYRKGQFEEALDYLLKAWKLDGTDDPEVCDHIGDTYQQLGETGKAIEFWEKALAHEKAAERVDVAAIEKKLEAAERQITQLKGKKDPEKPE